MIFLDTSSAIEILKGNSNLEILSEKYKGKIFAITSPSIFELYHGIYKLKFLKQPVSNQKYTHLHDDLDAFIEQLRVFFLSETSAKYAAKLHVQLQSKGQEIDVFDCLIAAIIITNDYKIIITKNKKHFMRIGLLKVLSF